MLNPQEIQVLLDPAVRPLGHLLEGKPVLDPLDGPRHGGRDSLDAALDRRLEECDVALPLWGPLEGLAGDALLGAREEHVEGGERGDAGRAEGEYLGATGSGDADRHGGCGGGWME